MSSYRTLASPSHITVPADAELIAYVSDLDMAAVRIGGREVLYLDGSPVPLPGGSHSAAQLVINVAAASQQGRTMILRALRSLISGSEG